MPSIIFGRKVDDEVYFVTDYQMICLVLLNSDPKTNVHTAEIYFIYLLKYF